MVISVWWISPKKEETDTFAYLPINFSKNYTFQVVKSTKIVWSENLLQFSDTYK